MKKIALTLIAVCTAGITFAAISEPSNSVINKEEHKCHGFRCVSCDGRGFQGNYNFPCINCKGTGVRGSY